MYYTSGSSWCAVVEMSLKTGTITKLYIESESVSKLTMGELPTPHSHSVKTKGQVTPEHKAGNITTELQS